MNHRIIISLLLILPFSVKGQKIVTGKIFDNNLKALQGAQIETLDKSIFAKTDHKGYFRLEIPYGFDTVGIWYLGMSYEKVFIKNSTVLNYVLFPNMNYNGWSGDDIKKFLEHRHKQRKNILKQAGLYFPADE